MINVGIHTRSTNSVLRIGAVFNRFQLAHVDCLLLSLLLSPTVLEVVRCRLIYVNQSLNFGFNLLTRKIVLE